MKKALGWVAGALGVLGAILAVVLFRRNRQVAGLRSRVRVERAKGEVSKLQGQRAAELESAAADAAKVRELNERIRERRRAAVAEAEAVEDLDDAAILQKWKELGF